ncbi:MAG: alpha/beta hydrolase [Alphaproteobacteria bacterium]|nr:alpha/beta hydrolase [Alphaproteobacteria bacterium]
MPRTLIHRPLRYAARSFLSLIAVTATTVLRRLVHGPLVASWSLGMEIGILFVRRQLNHAFSFADIREARKFLDGLDPPITGNCEVQCGASPGTAPRGQWITPGKVTSDVTLLYLHGGGYSFYPESCRRFAGVLATLFGARLFAADYRLTPEHRHPAQRDDALSAYRYLLDEGIDPRHIVVIGDSAGGHLTLLTLLSLRQAGLPQPALAVALSPATDVDMTATGPVPNDRYDILQSHMLQTFGKWLIDFTAYSREDLALPFQDFRAVAPIYIQAGGREVLCDAIRDFVRVLEKQGCEMTFDVWPDMIHVFQYFGTWQKDSRDAIARIRSAIAHYTGSAGTEPPFAPDALTENSTRPHRAG